MKKIIIILVALTLILSLITIACSQKQQGKSYVITTYKITLYADQPEFGKSEFGKKYLSGTSTKTPIHTYYAKKIIDYSDTSARFIDNTGKEQFISADYIEVKAS